MLSTSISIYSRLDAIATDAELEDKAPEDLSRLADILHNGCVRAVSEYEEKLKEDPNFDGELLRFCYNGKQCLSLKDLKT